MAQIISTSEIKAFVKIPPYVNLTITMDIQTQGHYANVTVLPWVHVKHTRKTRYIPKEFYVTAFFDDLFHREILQPFVDKAAAKLIKILDNGKSYEYEYDDRGEVIPGSRHIVEFNDWIIFDKHPTWHQDAKVIKRKNEDDKSS